MDLEKIASDARTIWEREEPEPDEITVRTLAGFIAVLADELAAQRGRLDALERPNR